MVKIRQEYEITEESSSKESKRKDTVAQAVARLNIFTASNTEANTQHRLYMKFRSIVI